MVCSVMFTRATVPGIRCNRCILQIGIFCRSFLSLNRFSFQMSEFANLVKSWIFSRQIPVNQKSLPGIIFGWVQMQNFFLMSNVRDPPNLINHNLGDDQKTGISTDMRPAFSHEFLKKWVDMLTLWSRNQDCWLLLFT